MRAIHPKLALTLLLVAACGEGGDTGGTPAEAPTAHAERLGLISLWAAGTPAFGVFVPDERPAGERAAGGRRLPPVHTEAGGAALAGDDLLDYVFLNLEGGWDPEAVSAIAAGLSSVEGVGRKALLVRIPPISADGEEAARVRVAEAFERGADGVVVPHVRSPEEASLAVSMFSDAGVRVWSSADPGGDRIAMLMIEDPGALEARAAIADTPGYSVLACGIGSLTRALGGDRAAGEAGTQAVLVESRRVGVPNMITADAADVERRIEEGFLGLLMQGDRAAEAIRTGRAAAGR